MNDSCNPAMAMPGSVGLFFKMSQNRSNSGCQSNNGRCVWMSAHGFFIKIMFSL